MKNHYHCRKCGIVLTDEPNVQNELSYYCDDCLIQSQVEGGEQ